MFVPTGWTDWELVFAAGLWAWLALGMASVVALSVAYGLFREPAGGRVAASVANDRSTASDVTQPANRAAVSAAPASTPAAELATAS